MRYLHEIVEMNENIPAKIIIHNKFGGNIPTHWHKALELTYLTDGNFSCYINGKCNNICKNDLIIINSGDIHGINIKAKESSSGITIMISYDFLKHNYNGIDNIEFIINNNELMKESLKKLLCDLLNMYKNKIEQTTLDFNLISKDQLCGFYYLKVKSIIYEILFILLTYFTVNKDIIITIKSQKYIDRFKKITQYIEQNYKENLALADVANYYGLSREHLARSFKKYMGITFSDYLNSIRLYNAYRQLITTDYSITQIGLDNGFPNVASFINKFKIVYGQTPNKYRYNIKNITN
ncbi:helix-turn-helix domain-containing protein [Clostridium butyricum]